MNEYLCNDSEKRKYTKIIDMGFTYKYNTRAKVVDVKYSCQNNSKMYVLTDKNLQIYSVSAV